MVADQSYKSFSTVLLMWSIVVVNCRMSALFHHVYEAMQSRSKSKKFLNDFPEFLPENWLCGRIIKARAEAVK